MYMGMYLFSYLCKQSSGRFVHGHFRSILAYFVVYSTAIRDVFVMYSKLGFGIECTW